VFQNILLPVDLADRHHAAITLAAKLASPEATVTLLHVIETIGELSTGEEQNFYRSFKKNSRTFLERLGKQLEDRKISWRAEILLGRRTSDTVRYATEIGADLIILTAPRFDPSNPGANWGSLSFKISMLAQCPVLMVK
jgi:universal stress protein A